MRTCPRHYTPLAAYDRPGTWWCPRCQVEVLTEALGGLTAGPVALWGRRPGTTGGYLLGRHRTAGLGANALLTAAGSGWLDLRMERWDL